MLGKEDWLHVLINNKLNINWECGIGVTYCWILQFNYNNGLLAYS